MLSDELSFGEDSVFDVPNLIHSVTSNYVGFSLRTMATNVVSSIKPITVRLA